MALFKKIAEEEERKTNMPEAKAKAQKAEKKGHTALKQVEREETSRREDGHSRHQKKSNGIPPPKIAKARFTGVGLEKKSEVEMMTCCVLAKSPHHGMPLFGEKRISWVIQSGDIFLKLSHSSSGLCACFSKKKTNSKFPSLAFNGHLRRKFHFEEAPYNATCHMQNS